MTPTTTPDIASRVADHALTVALEMAITDRWSWRTWYRTSARRLFGDRWDDLAAVNERELRRLVHRLRRLRAAREEREEREHATHEGEQDCGLCMQAQDFYARYPA